MVQKDSSSSTVVRSLGVVSFMAAERCSPALRTTNSIPVTPGAISSALKNRVVLLQEFCKERHREVNLTASGTPDEPLLDERLPVHRYLALVVDAERPGDRRHRVWTLPEGRHGG